ncbi:MAG: hypothetical protein Q9167_002143 [Letrouitia subvulpina]
MAPTEHGEVFVLDDGGEVDLDLGNYERYLNITLTRENNITTGKIYQHVIERERRGDYLGRTVQVVPHLTDAIQDWIQRVAEIPVDDTKERPDVCIIELGGTVGDIESGPFIEALRQLKRRAGKDNFLQCHVSLIPIVNGEQKTKPTQQAIKKQDVSSTYHVPLLLEQQGLVPLLRNILQLSSVTIAPTLTHQGSKTWEAWKSLTMSQDLVRDTVTIALIGKYTNLRDSYLSVIKSLEHAALACSRKLNLVFVDASHLEQGSKTSPSEFHKAWHEVHTANGIIVPGGFGRRGTEGMIAAAHCARTNKIPYLGICLGFQIACIEFARNVCNVQAAASIELDERTSDPVIIHMPEIDRTTMGATMRLGLRPTHFQSSSEWSKLRTLYHHNSAATLLNGNLSTKMNGTTSTSELSGATSSPVILERHRHRYEVNPAYVEMLNSHGLSFIAKDDSGERMEILELKDHPWFVGVQFHPEYLSRVLRPSKPYLGFVAASAGCLDHFLGRHGVDGARNWMERVNI